MVKANVVARKSTNRGSFIYRDYQDCHEILSITHGKVAIFKVDSKEIQTICNLFSMDRLGLIRFLAFAIFAVLTYPTSITQGANGQEIRNCVNVKTGKARLVTPKTIKCKKWERKVRMRVAAFLEFRGQS